MANDLFDLFSDKLKSPEGLIASDPQSLDTLAASQEDQEFLIERIAELEEVELKVDYSDFTNFVFFNSALDYFNISGEKILNEYPQGGTRDLLKRFDRSLDAYQRHVLKTWPHYAGHLRFNNAASSSYIVVDDVGQDPQSNSYRTSILSPGTGSITIEAWFNAESVITGTDVVQVLAQKLSASDGYSLFLTGSVIRFEVTSGSITDSVESPYTAGSNQFVSAVFDRASFTGSISIMTGSAGEFPVTVQSASIAIFGPMHLGGTSFTIGSGSITGKTIEFFTGSLDELKVWKKPRSITEVSGTFNIKQYAETNLVALYRFNESGSAFDEANNSIVLDSSGRSLDGRIQSYYFGMRGSGSFLLREDMDPVLNVESADVSSYILEQQTSGSAYDRANGYKLIDMVPEYYLSNDTEISHDVLKNFLYVYGRNFDNIKLHIEQFTHILSLNYGKFDQTPDELLDVYAKFFGWEFTGNFLNADAFQYMLGKNVLANVNSNTELDTKLFEIKNEFWRRVLLNLIYIYKTKGTKESIKAMMRSYGVNENFVRIKEYGHTPNVGIQTKRITSEKSEHALGFASGTLTGTLIASFATDLTESFTVEGTFRFPLTSSSNIVATQLSGTLFGIGADNAAEAAFVIFEKDSLASHSGTLMLTSSDGTNYLELTGAGIFNNEWYHVSVTNDHVSSSLKLEVRHLDEDEIDGRWTTSSSSVESGVLFSEQWTSFTVGGGGGAAYNMPLASEYWAREFRWWDEVLVPEELDDHTLNFQSYGVCDVDDRLDNLKLHWRLREDLTASVAGGIESIEDVATESNTAATLVSGFNVSENPYQKFLDKYNYIASIDFGWNDDKIRTFDSTKINSSDFVNDMKMVSLEFNMIDALNEGHRSDNEIT